VPAAGDSTGAAVGTPWQSKLGTVLGGGRGLDDGLLSDLMLRLVERRWPLRRVLHAGRPSPTARATLGDVTQETRLVGAGSL
jgi:hypothetical protein